MPTVGGGSTWVEQENFNQIESAINQLQISVNDLTYDVGRILSALNRGTTPTALTIDVANQGRKWRQKMKKSQNSCRGSMVCRVLPTTPRRFGRC